MKEENFKRAKKIERDISLLRENIEDVRLRAFCGGELKDKASLKIVSDGIAEELIPSLMVLPLKDFITLYISRAEERIKELEKEFEEL